MSTIEKIKLYVKADLIASILLAIFICAFLGANRRTMDCWTSIDETIEAGKYFAMSSSISEIAELQKEAGYSLLRLSDVLTSLPYEFPIVPSIHLTDMYEVDTFYIAMSNNAYDTTLDVGIRKAILKYAHECAIGVIDKSCEDYNDIVLHIEKMYSEDLETLVGSGGALFLSAIFIDFSRYLMCVLILADVILIIALTAYTVYLVVGFKESIPSTCTGIVPTVIEIPPTRNDVYDNGSDDGTKCQEEDCSATSSVYEK